MPSQSLTNPSYRTLISAVKLALTSGLRDVQRLVEYQRLMTYWTIGDKILKVAETSDGGLTLNEELYQRISHDVERSLGLELKADTIGRSIQFRKTYPVFPKNTPLTFTHYLALIRVADKKKRLKLEKAAVKETMSSYYLKQKVHELNAAPIELFPTKAKKLPFERGEPYIYYLRPFTDLTGEEHIGIDCGFKIHLPLDGAIRIKPVDFTPSRTRYVQSVKKGDGYSLTLAVRKRASVYTYAAKVTKVVDGDTLDALVDVGFGIRVCERFRLKGINAPETTTPAGHEAKAFLTNYLAQCPVIVVRTMKAEMYGRWLGDIFTLAGSNDPHTIAVQGEYVNQLLLNRGLAVHY